uniref:Fatty acyl-CoA reductase n=1 Tax=Nilaparvata lugens TaxID=108931 RepID=A0A3Q8FVH6_NILLU|nr:fatty acyl-CoA reductase [Nilaparvata lugens]
MRNLECYLYVSTAYSNSHLDIAEIEEKIYPTEYDYKMLIELIESHADAEPALIEILAKKIINNHPNTYTFSKALAEQVMVDYSTKIPVVIVRPSVVINSMHEPLVGWLENLNGPMGIIAGVTKGILRVFLANEDCSLDYVAVDYAINSLIVSAWHKAVAEQREKKQLTIYNCVYGNVKSATFGDIINAGPSVSNAYPYTDVLWYPSIITTTNTKLFTFLFYILQIIPSLLLDAVLWLFSYDTMFLKISRKIYIVSFALQVFSTKIIKFSNRCYQSLWTTVSESDSKIFYMDPPEHISAADIILTCHLGMRKFYFHESESNIPQARAKFNRLYWADRALRVFVIGIFTWFSSKYVMNRFS